MLHILLLEEYPPLRRVLEMTLRRAGYCVTLARSADEAQKLLAQQAFDVLVGDLDTLQGRHNRLIAALRTAPATTPIVALLSPGYGRQDRLAALGIRLLLIKPVSRQALLAAIHTALRT